MNSNLIRRFAAQFLSFALASSLFAQSMTVNPDPTLTAGGQAQIDYTNAGLANQTVQVTITGSGSGQSAVVELQLDSNGHAKKSWTVPHWRDATFSAPGVSSEYRAIY